MEKVHKDNPAYFELDPMLTPEANMLLVNFFWGDKDFDNAFMEATE